jgi:hypothetical protein
MELGSGAEVTREKFSATLDSVDLPPVTDVFDTINVNVRFDTGLKVTSSDTVRTAPVGHPRVCEPNENVSKLPPVTPQVAVTLTSPIR